MLKKIALSAAVALSIGITTVPVHASITPSEFIAAAQVKIDELELELSALLAGPQTPATQRQARVLQRTAWQLESLSRIATRRPPSYLERMVNYYQLAVSGN
ncbi:MAG: hypothetical protein AB8B71_15660 [Paracoccaceae bacterium]